MLLASCAINPVTGEQELMLVSEAQELKIGKDAAPSLKWEFSGYYHDPELEAYLNDIVLRLWQTSERPHLPVKFYIQNTSVPNAFALPGYVAITRGLLGEMENEAQFAAVMGHETGHVMARHTAQRITWQTVQQLGLGLAGAALEGKSGSDALLAIGSIGSSLYLLSYSRDQEIQADMLGVKYMSSLGYDPYEAVSAHVILERSVDNYLKRLGKSAREDTLISSLFSTHPRKEVRIDEIRSMINQLSSYTVKGDGKFSSTFTEATKKLRDVNKVYFLYDMAEKHYMEGDIPEAEKKLKEAISRDSSQPAFHNLYGFIKLKDRKHKEAETAFTKTLLIEKDYQPAVYGMGIVHYYNENYQSAIKEFSRSLELYPDHVLSYFGIGKSFFQLKEHSKAISYLDRFAGAVPKHNEVHGLLGICLEASGEIRPAVIEYNYQVQIEPNSEIGQYAKKRLAALTPLIK